MMDVNERVIPGQTVHLQLLESEARYVFALRYIEENDIVLDVGSGTGYGAKILSKQGNITGVDNNEEAVSFATREYSKYGRFVIGDVYALPFQDACFDVVTSFEVVEHLKDTKTYFQEILRVLKPQGTLILSTPNRLYPERRADGVSPYHFKEYSSKEFEKLCNRYFGRVVLFGEYKSKKAKKAFRLFLKSQMVRQKTAETDILGIRKIVPKHTKNRIWKVLARYFGSKQQEELNVNDFKFSTENVENAEYLLAVCQK